MRLLSILALTVLASIACGTEPQGNSYVTEQALTVGNPNAVRVIPISVDSNDTGCSVDGIRFTSCRVASSSPGDLSVANLCQLDVGEVGEQGRFFVECDSEEAEAPRKIKEIPHCPGGH